MLTNAEKIIKEYGVLGILNEVTIQHTEERLIKLIKTSEAQNAQYTAVARRVLEEIESGIKVDLKNEIKEAKKANPLRWDEALFKSALESIKSQKNKIEEMKKVRQIFKVFEHEEYGLTMRYLQIEELDKKIKERVKEFLEVNKLEQKLNDALDSWIEDLYKIKMINR
ncbi:hypothetical protein [Clostridium tarantellae]|uniref:Uncharacterized protein n=1 Tax=Clostridium tarantellae TaxID=39493 RepID=A0A6I1MM40_9CLOT|nr:hypothetical protein [Clostridium tarantellae]MPQ44060.1 hypothetical protein [Clostridium tarantellae]